MLRWAVIFLVIALVAALLGFIGIASAAAGIAEISVRPFPGPLPDLLHPRFSLGEEGGVKERVLAI